MQGCRPPRTKGWTTQPKILFEGNTVVALARRRSDRDKGSGARYKLHKPRILALRAGRTSAARQGGAGVAGGRQLVLRHSSVAVWVRQPGSLGAVPGKLLPALHPINFFHRHRRSTATPCCKLLLRHHAVLSSRNFDPFSLKEALHAQLQVFQHQCVFIGRLTQFGFGSRQNAPFHGLLHIGVQALPRFRFGAEAGQIEQLDSLCAPCLQAFTIRLW